MDGTRKYHPGRGNSDPKEHACYVLTDKLILVKNWKIFRIQPTNHKKCNKQKCPSKDILIPLGRGIKQGRNTEGSGWKR